MFILQQIEETGLAHAFYTTLEDGQHYRLNDPDSYEEYDQIAKNLRTVPEQMARLDQTHSTLVYNARPEDAGAGIIKQSLFGDGVITSARGLVLCTVEADCAPVYILDPVRRVVGMVHSGWRGTANKIVGAALALMRFNHGSSPADLIVMIGPSICGDCYEVGDDLAKPFGERFTPLQMSRMFKNTDKSRTSEEEWKAAKEAGYPVFGRKFLLDIKSGITITLMENGVNSKNIYFIKECTYENKDLASFRRTKDKDIRMLTGIVLV